MKVIIETEDEKRIYKIPIELLLKELDMSLEEFNDIVKKVLSKHG